jgi:hypothetical protein
MDPYRMVGIVGDADDNSPNTQEPDEAKVSRPVLKQRRGQPWPRLLRLRLCYYVPQL